MSFYLHVIVLKYTVVDQIHTGRYYIQRFLARSFGFDVDDIKVMSEVKVGTTQ